MNNKAYDIISESYVLILVVLGLEVLLRIPNIANTAKQ